MTMRWLAAVGVCAAFLCLPLRAQVIEFESNGVRYQTLTKSGVTVMLSLLPAPLHAYAILQVSVDNASEGPYVIRPENFTFDRTEGSSVRAVPAQTVIQQLTRSSRSADVLKLVSAYENSLYGMPKMRSTNGYESRRQAALLFGPSRLRAAAAASAVALVETKLSAGESTDGAVFIPTGGKPLGAGRVVIRTNTDTFEFNPESPSTPNH